MAHKAVRLPDGQFLTTGQVEVGRVMARGLTVAGAADELCVSPRTVASHLRRLYRKLGVCNRVMMVKRLQESGVVLTDEQERED